LNLHLPRKMGVVSKKNPAPAAFANEYDEAPVQQIQKKRKDGHREELDQRIERDIMPACPLKWDECSDVHGLSGGKLEEADLCLCVGWDDYKGDAALLHNCVKHLKREMIGEDVKEIKAAKKALRMDLQRDGLAENLSKYLKKADRDCDFNWSVRYGSRKKLSKVNAVQYLEKLFHGDYCRYPEGYDNFGVTPFSRNFHEANAACVTDSAKVALQLRIKEYVSILQERSQSVEYSFWMGHSQDVGNETCSKREDFFFFHTEDGQKFLLKFRSHFLG